MNDETMRRLLEDTAEYMVPSAGSPTDLPSLLHRRRQRRRATAGLAAVAAAVVGVAIAFSSLGNSGPSHRVTILPPLSGPSTTGVPARTDVPSVEFRSPSANIECELDGPGFADGPRAFCQTMTPSQSVTMSPDGSFRTCTGISCLGNAGTQETVLPYGSRTALGAFECTSDTTGVTCRSVSTGNGFHIDRSGITAVSPGSAKGPGPAAGSDSQSQPPSG